MRAVRASSGGARRWARARLVVIAALALAVAALAAPPARAHRVPPEGVIARLRDPELERAFGVVSVARSEELPRLLVIRVDARWRAAERDARRRAAEIWFHEWRRSTPQGVLAIVDAETQDSLVSFDAYGSARLKGEGRPALR